MGNLKTESLKRKLNEEDFSGVLSLSSQGYSLMEKIRGYRNEAEGLPNLLDTRFQIASGCKIFTAVAISQLVDQGKLTFDTTINQCLPQSFPLWNDDITLHHLLTHTSGIPDYFDEDEMDNYEELWRERPTYQMKNPVDFLPLFQHEAMKHTPGEAFHYNNGAFILLGLVVEEVSGQSFRDYVQEHVFDVAGMGASGYFSMDRLPKQTALGYIDDESGKRTNSYALPIIGGPDGGAYVTVKDMECFWDALIHHKLLNPDTTNALLTPYQKVTEDIYYGYGVWLKKQEDEWLKCYVMGYDPGVSFHSAYYMDSKTTLTICSNYSEFPFSFVLALEQG
ncbi:serine hydrolase domain-containing protein [Halobacillus salinus]|uniref:serine hydrolase domain-containing protein n=1 Tax=Halobacillus salinus TaxID=192814 RepID=UPI0009A8A64D|nr:serine hydrolase [Halobacillus salinus]